MNRVIWGTNTVSDLCVQYVGDFLQSVVPHATEQFVHETVVGLCWVHRMLRSGGEHGAAWEKGGSTRGEGVGAHIVVIKPARQSIACVLQEDTVSPRRCAHTIS